MLLPIKLKKKFKIYLLKNTSIIKEMISKNSIGSISFVRVCYVFFFVLLYSFQVTLYMCMCVGGFYYVYLFMIFLLNQVLINCIITLLIQFIKSTCYKSIRSNTEKNNYSTPFLFMFYKKSFFIALLLVN